MGGILAKAMVVGIKQINQPRQLRGNAREHFFPWPIRRKPPVRLVVIARASLIDLADQLDSAGS